MTMTTISTLTHSSSRTFAVRTAAAVGCCCLALASVGCIAGAIGALGQQMERGKKLDVPAQYDGLDGKTTAVSVTAEEVTMKKGGARKKIGRIILKGDNISLICNIR